MYKPLFLFITLLCILSISIYFGNANVDKKEGATGSIIEGATNDDVSIASIEGATNGDVSIASIDGNTNATSVSTTTPLSTTATTLSTTATPLSTTAAPLSTTAAATTASCNSDKMSDYYKWFEYWNKVVKSEDINSASNSSDYILKTQIIPPVCPSCPSCSASNGVCTSCGGQGGCGTNGKYRNRFSDFVAIYGAGYKGDGKWTSIIGDGDSSNSNNKNNDGDSVTGLLRDTGSGAKDLLEDTGSGATGLLRDTGSGATGLLRDTASGATGLLRDAGSGVAGILKTNPLQINNHNQNQNQNQNQPQSQQYVINPYQTGYYTQGTYNHPNNPLGIQGIDPYSYNGALVSKGSNYIPVTSDFSSFRK